MNLVAVLPILTIRYSLPRLASKQPNFQDLILSVFLFMISIIQIALYFHV